MTSSSSNSSRLSILSLRFEQDTFLKTEKISDAISIFGTDTYEETTTKGLSIGAVRTDIATTLVDTNNEIGALQMDTIGNLRVTTADSTTIEGNRKYIINEII